MKSIDTVKSTRSQSLPKYRLLRDIITARVHRGELKPGHQLMPVKELQIEYGLSFATVMRALTELEASGIIERLWGKGNFIKTPRQITQNLAITFDSRYSITHPRRVRLCQGLADQARQDGFDLQMFPLNESQLFEGRTDLLLTKLLKAGDISGIVCCSPHPASDMHQLASLGVPTVVINHEYPEANIVQVGVSHTLAAEQIVSHFLAQGHKRLGLVMGAATCQDSTRIRSSQRLASAILTRIQEEPSLDLAGRVVYTDYEWGTARKALKRWMKSRSRPTAVFCLEEHLTINTIELAVEMGLKIPGDLSVMGMGWLANQGITSLRTPDYETGQYAINALSALIQGRQPTSRLFETTLEIHGSTGPA